MKKTWQVVSAVLIIVALLFFLGLSIGSMRSMPEHAYVYLDDASKRYYAPPLVEKGMNMRLGTCADAHMLDYGPDPRCRDAGGFIQEGRTLTGLALQRLGILRPIPSRWNEDGTWNY